MAQEILQEYSTDAKLIAEEEKKSKEAKILAKKFAKLNISQSEKLPSTSIGNLIPKINPDSKLPTNLEVKIGQSTNFLVPTSAALSTTSTSILSLVDINWMSLAESENIKESEVVKEYEDFEDALVIDQEYEEFEDNLPINQEYEELEDDTAIDPGESLNFSNKNEEVTFFPFKKNTSLHSLPVGEVKNENALYNLCIKNLPVVKDSCVSTHKQNLEKLTELEATIKSQQKLDPIWEAVKLWAIKCLNLYERCKDFTPTQILLYVVNLHSHLIQSICSNDAAAAQKKHIKFHLKQLAVAKNYPQSLLKDHEDLLTLVLIFLLRLIQETFQMKNFNLKLTEQNLERKLDKAKIPAIASRYCSTSIPYLKDYLREVSENEGSLFSTTWIPCTLEDLFTEDHQQELSTAELERAKIFASKCLKSVLEGRTKYYKFQELNRVKKEVILRRFKKISIL